MFNYPIRIIFTLFLSVVVLAIIGCDRPSGAFEKMDLAESLMDSRPDSALSILNAINIGTLGGKRNKARYALLKSMALDKNYIDTTSFDVLQPAIDYFLRKGTADEKLKTYYYQGRVYQNRENNDSAMQSFMRGIEYRGQASDTTTMANLLVAQGTILYTTYKYDDFIKVNLEAAGLYKQIGRPDYEMLSLANVLDGSILNGDKELADSIMSIAQVKLSNGRDLSPAITPYVLSYVVKFGTKEDINSILNYYNSLDSIDDVTKMNVALAYCKIGDGLNAKRVWDEILSSSDVCRSLKYLSIKPVILEQSGDFAGALEAYQQFATKLDSIHLDIFSHDLLFAKERHDMEKSNLLTLHKRDRFIWLSLCAAFALLIIAGCIYYRYRLSQAKNLLEEQENKKLQLEQENLKKKTKILN